jgi:hypothetical protein
MPTFPTVDESLDRLHRAGWSVGDAGFGPDHALTWLATGTNGENAVKRPPQTVLHRLIPLPTPRPFLQ